MFSKPRAREIVVGAGRAAAPAAYLLERARGDEPFVQRLAADAERIFEALARAGAVAVERDREIVYAQAGHVAAFSPIARAESSRC